MHPNASDTAGCSPLGALLPPNVALVWTRRSEHPSFWDSGLHVEEQEALGRAVPKRRQEFTAGRNCARQAMRLLGLPTDLTEAPIGVGTHREPLFPPGVLGSITHCENFCAAAITRADDTLVGIGIDVEVRQPLEPGVAALVMQAQERPAWASAMGKQGDSMAAAFSIKEAFFKAVFPLCRRYLDFNDVWLSPDSSGGTGRFSLSPIDPSLAACVEGLRIVGRMAADDCHVYSAVTLYRRTS
jgi:4'-phosphopantetheinyl transferase EntD